MRPENAGCEPMSLQPTGDMALVCGRSSPRRSCQLDSIDIAYDELRIRYDNPHGGFGGAPKFPTTHHILFLLRFWQASKDLLALQMAGLTLMRMRLGGVFDQIGLGMGEAVGPGEFVDPGIDADGEQLVGGRRGKGGHVRGRPSGMEIAAALGRAANRI